MTFLAEDTLASAVSIMGWCPSLWYDTSATEKTSPVLLNMSPDSIQVPETLPNQIFPVTVT
jgi:hypothetical protein